MHTLTHILAYKETCSYTGWFRQEFVHASPRQIRLSTNTPTNIHNDTNTNTHTLKRSYTYRHLDTPKKHLGLPRDPYNTNLIESHKNIKKKSDTQSEVHTESYKTTHRYTHGGA